MTLPKTWRSMLLPTLIVGLVAGGLLGNGLRVVKAAATQTAPDATPLQIPDPVQLSTAFSKLAKQLEPSVVQVTSTIEQKTVQRRGGRQGSEVRRIRKTCSGASSARSPSATRPAGRSVISAARPPVPASSWTRTAISSRTTM